jgi:5'-nucleotidase
VILAIDVDGPTADLYPRWTRLHNEMYPERTPYRVEDVYGLRAQKDDEFLRLLTLPTLYDYVEPVVGALDAINLLRDVGHRVLFATSCVQGMHDPKWQWLQRHGFLPRGFKQDPNLIDVHDKSLIRADLLVDDVPGNILKFPGKGILYDAPYNQGTLDLVRAHNWLDVVGRIDFYVETGKWPKVTLEAAPGAATK